MKDLGDTDGTVTRINAIVGTPHYLPPEAVSAPDRVGPKSDLYSLGCVAYYMLTGAEPFDGKSLVELCSQHLHQTPVSLSERLGAPILPELEALVMRCMAKDADSRPDAVSLVRRLQVLGVEAWTTDDAQDWWERHVDLLAGSRAERPRASPLTIEVGGGAAPAPPDP